MVENIKRGEIYLFENKLATVGSEQKGTRPGVIVSNDKNNEFSGNVTVVWLTTQPKKSLPTHVKIYTTKEPSTALCEGVVTVSKERIINYINTCSTMELNEIDDALCVQLNLTRLSVSDVQEEHNEENDFVYVIPEDCDVASDSESKLYIRQLETERDIFKGLYEKLLSKITE